jgi:hypothetical protein
VISPIGPWGYLRSGLRRPSRAVVGALPCNSSHLACQHQLVSGQKACGKVGLGPPCPSGCGAASTFLQTVGATLRGRLRSQLSLGSNVRAPPLPLGERGARDRLCWPGSARDPSYRAREGENSSTWNTGRRARVHCSRAACHLHVSRLLTKWCLLSRLVTRTNESNMYASTRVLETRFP